MVLLLRTDRRTAAAYGVLSLRLIPLDFVAVFPPRGDDG